MKTGAVYHVSGVPRRSQSDLDLMVWVEGMEEEQSFSTQVLGVEVNVLVTGRAFRKRALRHRQVQRVLHRNFPRLSKKVAGLKDEGVKTEAAWCAVLGLEGDPYELMLDVRRCVQEARKVSLP